MPPRFGQTSSARASPAQAAAEPQPMKNTVARAHPPPLCRLQNQVGALLPDHDRRGIGVAGHDRRHDRARRSPAHPLEPMHAQRIVYHRHPIPAPCGTNWSGGTTSRNAASRRKAASSSLCTLGPGSSSTVTCSRIASVAKMSRAIRSPATTVARSSGVAQIIRLDLRMRLRIRRLQPLPRRWCANRLGQWRRRWADRRTGRGPLGPWRRSRGVPPGPFGNAARSLRRR